MDAYSSFARRPPVRPTGIEPFDTPADWRAAAARRFDGQVANDWRIDTPPPAVDADPVDPIDWRPIARWAVIVGGGLVAAMLGAQLGGGMVL